MFLPKKWVLDVSNTNAMSLNMLLRPFDAPAISPEAICAQDITIAVLVDCSPARATSCDAHILAEPSIQLPWQR